MSLAFRQRRVFELRLMIDYGIYARRSCGAHLPTKSTGRRLMSVCMCSSQRTSDRLFWQASDAVSISVTVTISTVYPGSTGGAIFFGQDIAGKYVRFVAGRDRIFRVPIVGEAWLLEGV